MWACLCGMIVLIVNWFRMANTTVDSTIPWAGNPRLLNMSLQANKQETFSMFPVVLGREVSSLVRGTLWTSKQAAFKSLPWHSLMTICDPELQAKMNLSFALVRVYFHSDGKETSLGAILMVFDLTLNNLPSVRLAEILHSNTYRPTNPTENYASWKWENKSWQVQGNDMSYCLSGKNGEAKVKVKMKVVQPDITGKRREWGAAREKRRGMVSLCMPLPVDFGCL